MLTYWSPCRSDGSVFRHCPAGEPTAPVQVHPERSPCSSSIWAPADDASGEHVDHERHIEPALSRRNIREIRNPQLGRPVSLELTVDTVQRTWGRYCGDGCANSLAATHAAQVLLRSASRCPLSIAERGGFTFSRLVLTALCGREGKIFEQYSTAKYGGNTAGGRCVYYKVQEGIWGEVGNAGSSRQGRLTLRHREAVRHLRVRWEFTMVERRRW